MVKVCASGQPRRHVRRVGQDRKYKPYMTSCIGLARTIYIRCIYGIFGREIIKYTVIHGKIYGSGQLYSCMVITC